MPSRSTVLRPAATADSSREQMPSSAVRMRHAFQMAHAPLRLCQAHQPPSCIISHPTALYICCAPYTHPAVDALHIQLRKQLQWQQPLQTPVVSCWHQPDSPTQQVDVVHVQHAAVALRQQARQEHGAPLLHSRRGRAARWHGAKQRGQQLDCPGSPTETP